MTLKGRLSKLEAIAPQSLPAVDRGLLALKVRFMAELAGQGPKESPVEAIARLLGYNTLRQMTDAMRHECPGFQERWANAARKAS